MGFGLTLKLFLSHLFSEPAAALQGIGHSIKDIVEILFFYFTEISLTACYVILFILAARFLLRRAPKIYSYALWGVVYFKLVSVFRLKFFTRSLIPQPQIDKIYYNIAPDYTAFYSTEAGIVSQVNSEFVAPVPVVTPIYIPALIWFIVLCVILTLSAVMYLTAYSKLKNSSLNNLKDNVYTSDAISTPFVFGIVRPKIYLPKGLTEQQQNYVITHEKVHIRRGDHIIKLFAFVITCIHWFNPLVWLSFFLLEKDMEMSCDEKVLQILGHEHKKDYSYCILSLASDKRFVPKAYLSFGDSDTKKRIKNVLNYKKPAVIASVMTIIGIVVIAVGMLADSGVVYVPDAENTGNRTLQINFPVYDQRTEYNTEIFDADFALLMQLPADWSVEIPSEEDIKYPLVGVWNRMGIYDETNNLVGAIGYNIYDTAQTEPMAIYNQIALGNHYQFAVHGDDYSDVSTGDVFVTSTTSVYTSAVMASQLGLDSKEVINHGVLCRNSNLGVYVAIEIDNDAMNEAELNNFAHSVFIGDAVTSGNSPADTQNSTAYNYYNLTVEDINVTAQFRLPAEWSFEVRSQNSDGYADYLCLDEQLMFVYDIFDKNKNIIGAFTINPYNEYSGKEDDTMAIYGGAVGLANMYHFEVKSDAYIPVSVRDNGISAVTDVYHAPQLTNPGYTNPSVYHKGILCYNKNILTHFAMELDRNVVSEELITEIAESIYLYHTESLYPSKMEIAKFAADNDVIDILWSVAQKYGYTAHETEMLYVNAPWDYINCDFTIGGNDRHIKTVFDMFIDGKSESEINLFAINELLANGFTEDTLKTLTSLSFTPAEIYYMTDAKAAEFGDSIVAQLKESNSPGGTSRILMYEEIASQIFDDYRNNIIEYSDVMPQPPEDFIFPEMIVWDTTKFVQSETGYFYTEISSADGKYRMVISVNDNTYDNENPFDSEPVINYVAFFLK